MKVNTKIKNYIKYLTVFSFILMKTTLIGQNILIFNPIPSNFLLDPSINNSAALDKVEHSLTHISYQSGLGLLSEIRQLYASQTFVFNETQNGGLKIYSEQETKFFSKVKISGFYSVGVPLNKQEEITFGAQVNAAYIGFNSTFIRGNDWGLDLSLHSAYKSKKVDAAISLLQIPSTPIQPINFEIILQRYIESFVKVKFDLRPKYFLESGLLSRFNKDYFSIETDNKLIYNDQYGVMMSLRLVNNTLLNYAIGGIISLDPVIPYFHLALSYSNLTGQENLNQNSINVTLLRRH